MLQEKHFQANCSPLILTPAKLITKCHSFRKSFILTCDWSITPSPLLLLVDTQISTRHLLSQVSGDRHGKNKIMLIMRSLMFKKIYIYLRWTSTRDPHFAKQKILGTHIMTPHIDVKSQFSSRLGKGSKKIKNNYGKFHNGSGPPTPSPPVMEKKIFFFWN